MSFNSNSVRTAPYVPIKMPITGDPDIELIAKGGDIKLTKADSLLCSKINNFRVNIEPVDDTLLEQLEIFNITASGKNAKGFIGIGGNLQLSSNSILLHTAGNTTNSIHMTCIGNNGGIYASANGPIDMESGNKHTIGSTIANPYAIHLNANNGGITLTTSNIHDVRSNSNLVITSPTKGIKTTRANGIIVNDIVTTNAYSGTITDSGIIPSGLRNTVTVNNSVVTNNSLIFISVENDNTSAGVPAIIAHVANVTNGSYQLIITNRQVSSTIGTPVYKYFIIN